MNWKLQVGIPVVVLIVVFFGYLSYAHYANKVPAQTCVAGQGEICPTDYFVYEVQYYKDMLKKVSDYQLHKTAEEANHLNDQVLGMRIRLFSQVKDGGMTPNGTAWDDTKKKFITNPPPNAPVVSVPPAPPAAKPKSP